MTKHVPVEAAGWISIERVADLAGKLAARGVDLDLFLVWLGADALDHIQNEQYAEALEVIDKLSNEGAKQ